MQDILERFERFPAVYKIAATLALCLMMFVGYSTTFEDPLDQEIAQVRGKIADKNQELEKIRYQIQHLTEVEQEIRKLKNQLTEAISLLPVKAEIPSLLKRIAMLAEKAGLKIRSFRPLPEIDRKYYFEVPVQMKIEGQFSAAQTFFDQVGKMRRVVNLSNVAMARVDACLTGVGCKDPLNNLDIDVRAVTFRFAPTEDK